MGDKDKMVGYHHQLGDMSSRKLREIVKDWKPRHTAVLGVTNSST